LDWWWLAAPGLILTVASFALTLHGALSRSNARYLAGLRLRKIGFGLVFLGVGLSLVFQAVLAGGSSGMFVIGLVSVGFASLQFYAATDPMFRKP